MPRLSDTMEEGTVASWLKKEGDKVEEGDILAEIETDKATMEFESFYEGTLLKIGLEEGETIVTSAHFLLDSESSKTSDFKRMEPDSGEQPVSVWAQSTITGSMPGHRMITARHDAIPEWEWPTMSMDFLVDETVDFQALQPGLTLHLEFTRQNDDQVYITNIHIPDEKSKVPNGSTSDIQSATVNGVINHIDNEALTMNISREAILKWSRPASTMDFSIGESVDIERFNMGDEVVFEFEIQDGSFVIVRMHHTNSVDANPHTDH